MHVGAAAKKGASQRAHHTMAESAISPHRLLASLWPQALTAPSSHTLSFHHGEALVCLFVCVLTCGLICPYMCLMCGLMCPYMWRICVLVCGLVCGLICILTCGLMVLRGRLRRIRADVLAIIVPCVCVCVCVFQVCVCARIKKGVLPLTVCNMSLLPLY